MISYARSAGLVGPVDSADPVDPADRVDQVGSAGLVDPVDSAGLIDPSYPFDMLCYASYWNEDFQECKEILTVYCSNADTLHSKNC